MVQPKRVLEVMTIDSVAIAMINNGRLLEDKIVTQLGENLCALTEQSGYQRVVVNFCKVEYLSAAALGKFVVLRKNIENCKGKLALCCVEDSIFEAFKITGFDRIFKIYPLEEEAIQYAAA